METEMKQCYSLSKCPYGKSYFHSEAQLILCFWMEAILDTHFPFPLTQDGLMQRWHVCHLIESNSEIHSKTVVSQLEMSWNHCYKDLLFICVPHDRIYKSLENRRAHLASNVSSFDGKIVRSILKFAKPLQGQINSRHLDRLDCIAIFCSHLIFRLAFHVN